MGTLEFETLPKTSVDLGQIVIQHIKTEFNHSDVYTKSMIGFFKKDILSE